jgi:formamidopyrimidine-DNA glycosylase
VPELPDISLYIECLEQRCQGQPLERVRIVGPSLLRSVDPPLSEAERRQVRGFRRLGKRIVFELEDELFLVFHLMIAGRFRWREPGARPTRKTGLAALDFPGGTLLMTEASTKKRATLHLVRGEAALAEHDPAGLEVLEAGEAEFCQRITAENRTLKRALTDPRILSGIGNAYSDEILHRAGLSPVTLTSRLDPEAQARLYRATRDTLEEWLLRQRIVYAANETNYCAPCQTGGKLLADRALSRLLKKDWPRTLEELEEHKEQRRE